MGKITNIIIKTIQYCIFVLFAMLVLLVFGQVVLRYVFNSGFPWAEELSRYLFIWIIFLGISVGIHEKSHINIDFLACKFKNLKIIIWLGQLIFFGLLLYYGIIYSASAYDLISSTIRVRMSWIYMIIAISGGLSLWFIIFDIMQNMCKKREESI